MDIGKAQTLLAQEQLDALIASSGENIFYSSGFPTIPSVGNRGVFNQSRISEAVFCITRRDGEQVLICSAGIAGVAQTESRIKDIRFSGTGIFYDRGGADLPVVAEAPGDALVSVLKDLGLGGSRIGIESGFVSANLFEKLKKDLPGATLVNGSGVFVNLRKIKSVDEIGKIRNSVRMAEAGLIAAIEQVRVGTRERDVASAYKSTLLAAGCDWGTTSIAAGANSGECYNVAGEYAINDGDVVRFDLGAITQGYFSDLARSVCVGHVPSEVGRLYSALRSAVDEMIAAMKPGVRLGDVFVIGLETVQKADYPAYRRGNMGHSFGLLVHEPPVIGPNVDERLVPGMVMAVEAPYYVTERFGLNVEHNILITDDGVEVLDSLTTELLVR